MMYKCPPFLCAIALFVSIATANLYSQGNDEIQKATRVYALTGATLIPEPGQLLTGMTLILEDGLIASMGPSVPIPAHAHVIPCDSLYIYAGLIAGLSHAGQAKKPEGSSDRDDDEPGDMKINRGNPPDHLAGITPERRFREVFDPGDKRIGDLREVGFTLSHSLPEEGLFAGMGALLLLGEGRADELILREDLSVLSQFAGTRGMYPSNLLGVMASWRQLFREARLAARHQAVFNQGAGVKRPMPDQATKALIPVTKGELPVYFITPDTRDIGRALALKKELGFSLVLSDTRQAWDWIDDIRADQIPVMVAIDLPEDKKSDKKDAKNNNKDSLSQQVPVDPEVLAFEKRREESLTKHYQQAAMLHEAGIPFGFSVLKVKGKDILAHIRTMIEHGLPEEAALASLTTHPAKILGIDHLAGSIDKGKMANLVITTKPLFDKDAHVRYVFVDGKKFGYEESKKRKKSKDNGELVTLVGDWAYEIHTPDMVRTGFFRFSGEEDDPQVVLVDEDTGGELDAFNVERDGNSILFEAEVQEDGYTIALKFDLSFSDGTFEGDVGAGDFGIFPIEGSKVPE